MTEDKITEDIRRPNDELLQVVSFTIGDEEFGVDILKVQEINRMVEVTRIPNSPPYIEGVINLRGKVIPIVDLRTRFSIPKKEWGENTRIIVIEFEGKVVGFIVDAVREVLRIPHSITEPPPHMIAGIDAEYITAIGKLKDRMILLLDLECILGQGAWKQLQDVA